MAWLPALACIRMSRAHFAGSRKGCQRVWPGGTRLISACRVGPFAPRREIRMKGSPPPGTLLLTAVLLISLNLRPAVAALSPLLETIRADLALGYPALGLLTTIPVLCMGVFPAVAVAATARFGTKRTLGAAIALLAVAVAARLAGQSAIVLFGSALVAGMAIAGAQTLLPAVVKQHFGRRAPQVIGLSATVMTMGAGLAAGTTAILAATFGSWPLALAFWAIPAVAAAAFWLPFARGTQVPATERRTAGDGLPWREGRAWLITLFSAVAFSVFWSVLTWLAQAYRDQGWSSIAAGSLLAVLTAAQIVGSLVLSAVVTRSSDRRPSMILSLLVSTAGLAGVALAPLAAPWLWTIVMGLGMGPLFPLALMLPIDYGHDVAAVRRLTVMTSSLAYLLAALGPFVIGWLRGATGSFTIPFLTLALLVAAMLPLVRWFRPAQMHVDGTHGTAPMTPNPAGRDR